MPESPVLVTGWNQRRWVRVVLVAIVVGIVVYGLAYMRISRWGMAEAASHGLEGIAYARFDRILSPQLYTADIRNSDWRRHVAWRRFFYPAWLIDHALTDAPYPMVPPLVNFEQIGRNPHSDSPFVDNSIPRKSDQKKASESVIVPPIK